MKQKLSNLWGKDGTKSVLASLISILIGMVVGALIIIIVGAANPSLGLNSAWEGIRLVFGGLFSTGRDAAGTLTFGFNSTNLGNMLFRATPLILTGLSVAVAFKTGLFNIGAPGQYLMGTAATLILALTIPTETVPAPLVWLIAFLGASRITRRTPRLPISTRPVSMVWRPPSWVWTNCSPTLRSMAAS